MNVTECLVCGSKSNDLLFPVGEWTLMRCIDCGFVFVGVLLEWAQKKQINDERYAHDLWESAARRRMRDRDDRECLDEIESVAAKGRMLDIGCAGGDLLLMARGRGWSVAGIELDAGLARDAARKIGAENVHAGTIATYPEAQGKFDVIVMRSVVEHLPDPRVELARVRELLAPEGHLYVLVPNIASFESRLYGPRWFALTPGDHLWFFSPHTLRRLMESAAFSCVRMTTSESFRDVFVGAGFAVASALRDRLRRKRAPIQNAAQTFDDRSSASIVRRASRRFVTALEFFMEALRFVTFPLFALYAYVLKRTGRGASIRAIFVKSEKAR